MEDISFLIFKFFEPGWKYIYIKFDKQINKVTHFFKQTLKNIKINAFNTRVVHLWFVNTNVKFILDPYAAATYYTSYMTKINNSITS
jgi:hypothetical protein